MAKLIIEVSRDLKTVNDSIDELVKSKAIGSVGGKIYAAKFKLTQTALFNLIRSRVKDWIKEETKTYLLCIEESENVAYIDSSYKHFQNFLLGSEKEIENEAAYKNTKSDRVMVRILQILKSKTKRAKEGAIERALGGRTVLSFFTSCGILINYKLEK